MRWTVVSQVWQTSWTAANHVWCDKVATICLVTASIVKYLTYKYFKYAFEIHTEYFVFKINYKSISYFVFSEWSQKYWQKYFKYNYLKYFVFCIYYLIHYQKYVFTARRNASAVLAVIVCLSVCPWSISKFYTPLNFSEMAEDRIVKFYAR